MIETLLVTAAAELATVLVPVGMLVAWGLSGGDGTAENPVAPVAGLVVFLSSLAAWVASIGLLAAPWHLVFGAVLILGVVAWALLMTAFQDDRDRRRIYVALTGLALLLPLLFAMVADTRAPTRTTLLLVTTPLIAASVGFLAAPDLRGAADDEDRRGLLLAGAPFVGVPVLIGVVWLTSS